MRRILDINYARGHLVYNSTLNCLHLPEDVDIRLTQCQATQRSIERILIRARAKCIFCKWCKERVRKNRKEKRKEVVKKVLTFGWLCLGRNDDYE